MRAILAWLLGGLALAAAPGALGGAGLHATIDVATADAATLQTTISVAVGGASPPPPPSVANTMTVSDAGGAGLANYPLQFGRPFIRGAIPAGECPVVAINGAPAASQADVKESWNYGGGDGSVKFAVIAVVIASVPANGSVQLSFAAGPCNNTPLGQAQMLDPSYNFEAQDALSFPARLAGTAQGQFAATFASLADAGFAVTIDGTPYQVGPINFQTLCGGGCAIGDIAAALGAQLKTQSVPAYLTLNGGHADGVFTWDLKSTAIGAGHTISVLSAPASGTDISADLALDAASNPTITSGGTARASARAMLAAGDYKLWTSGPIAQTVILGDDTAARKYDIGLGDGHHPLRPRFYATFWPATHQVSIRYAMENGLTTDLEDMPYQAVLTAGSANPASVYTANLTGTAAANGFAKLHWAGSEWTKEAWLGGAPAQQVNIDNNLAYLAATRFVPNFDPSVTLSPATIQAEYANFLASPHDMYDGIWDGGQWHQYAGDPGDHLEIGMFPNWDVNWLYSGDWRERAYSEGMTDIAASFNVQYRESDPARRLLRSDATGLDPETGLGHVVSITDRKTLLVQRLEGYSNPGDGLTYVGPHCDNCLWLQEASHLAFQGYIPYLLTGDPWYLHELYSWASYDAAWAPPNGSPDARGPTGDEGAFDGEERDVAWHYRTRAYTAFIAPDSDPEKTYFTYLLNDALSRYYGGLGITGTPYDGNFMYVWGQSMHNPVSNNGGNYSGQAPPLGNLESNGDPAFPNPEFAGNPAINQANAGSYVNGFMADYAECSEGAVAALGFAMLPLAKHEEAFTVGAINSPVPKAGIIYDIPVEAYQPTNPMGNTPPGGFFPTWAVLEQLAFVPDYIAPGGGLDQAFTAALQNSTDNYAALMTCGVAEALDNGVPGADTAWAWQKANVWSVLPWGTRPQWDIVPRTDSNVLPAMPTTAPPS